MHRWFTLLYCHYHRTQAHLIAKDKKKAFASGEEYTQPSLEGNGGKVKAWELELLCNCLVQAILVPDGKEYTLNNRHNTARNTALVVELVEEYLT